MSENLDCPQITTLSNGFRVVTDHMPQVDSIALSLWVNVGSRFETEENCGIAHFLEHMAFKGTEKRTAIDIAKEFDAIGGQFNAYTSKEATVYYAKVLKENFTKALDIISDILLNSVFDEIEIEKERGVVLQEIAQTEDTPDDILFDKYMDTAYPSQPIGRPILGPKELVQAFNKSHLQDFVNQHYHSKNMLLSVSGNIKHDEVIDAASYISNKAPQKDNILSADPAEYKGGFYKENRDLEQLHIALGFKGLSYNDKDRYTIQVLSSILGGGMSSRLFQEVREKHGLAYAVASFCRQHKDCGMLNIYSGTEPQKVTQLLSIISQELKKMTQDITTEELERVKAQIKTNLLISRESNSARVDIAAGSYLKHGRYISKDEILAELNKINVNHVQELMHKILSSKDAITIAAIGNVEHLPTYDSILEQIKLGQ